MKNRLKILFLCLCLLILISGTASAKQLSVKKIIQNVDIKTGDSVTISLEIENPFNRSVPVTIKDNNVLGSNGLEIQCYEYTLQDITLVTVTYDFPVQAFSAGDFILDPATITYTNPDTGKQESIKSEVLGISIKKGPTSGELEGITRIYNCNGVSMRSTSYSSGGSTSIPISGGQANPHDNVQQAAQDMQNIKAEMTRQQQKYQKMQNELMNRIEDNGEFRSLKEELEKQGYTQQETDIQPESNDSGKFEYRFKKESESANISGKLNAGKMESINKQRFNDSQGRNASITGNVTNAGEINNISLNEKQEPLPYWMLIFLLVPLIGIYLYSKYRNKAKAALEAVRQVHTGPKEEALARLEKAVEIFNNGMQKEAYAEASNAVRMYLRGILGINELTSDEILKRIESIKDETYIGEARQFFMLCDLVKFAKYEPNNADFVRAVECAKRIIV